MSNTRIKYGAEDFVTYFQNSATSGFRCPVPMASLDSTANTDISNNLLSITSTIQLEGYIIGSGINACVSGYDAIVKYFSDTKKQGQTFGIYCSTALLVSYSGTTFKSSSAKPSENNWTVTLPYTINLESVSATGNAVIESYEDSWTIEPLEDISYYNFEKNSNLYDYNSTVVQTTNQPPSPSDLTSTARNLKIENILQYRITHRLSAVGKSIDRTNNNNPNPGGGITTSTDRSPAYIEAAKWVLEKSKDAYRNNFSSYGGVSVEGDGVPSSATSGLHLYNHMRTIDSNPGAGSYGLSDTWLALGTGVVFVEDMTFEVNTENFIQTVSLQGTVKGLEPANIPNNTYMVFPSSLMTGLIGQNFLNKFSAQTATNNKFYNAVGGYLSGIKPYLYDRASLALSAMNKLSTNPRSDGKNTIIQPTVYSRLNITPTNYNESLNPNAGTVGYSITYTNKPGSWISGALSSSINITENNQSDLVSESFVLGRPLGPILERVGFSKSERRVGLEVTFPIPVGYKESHPNSPDCIVNKNRAEYQQLKSLMESFKPIYPTAFSAFTSTAYPVANQGQIFKTADNQTWNPFEGRFSWDVTWIYNIGICS